MSDINLRVGTYHKSIKFIGNDSYIISEYGRESFNPPVYFAGNSSQRVVTLDKLIERGNAMMETAKSQENAIRKLLPKTQH